jgi:tRNA (cmo5U34)-methyltransferase
MLNLRGVYKMENNRNDVVNKFNEVSQSYDQQRKKLIPCFDDFYMVAVALADLNNDTPTVLDLGAGTGLFSSFILDKYPNAQLTLIDLSEGMLEIAKARFQQYPNVTYVVADYTKYEYNQRFDLVISSLSIHHLIDEEKRELYEKVYSVMNNNSLFINADQILGRTVYLDSLYKSEWKNKVENSGLNPDEISSAYERTKLDRMTTLDKQLHWLKEIGFVDVDCVYKYYNFVVLFARKLTS